MKLIPVYHQFAAIATEQGEIIAIICNKENDHYVPLLAASQQLFDAANQGIDAIHTGKNIKAALAALSLAVTVARAFPTDNGNDDDDGSGSRA